MIEHFRKMAGYWALALGIVFIAVFTGCQTNAPKYPDSPQESGNAFQIGELITVKCVPPSLAPDQTIEHTERIGDDGNITLPYIGQVKAEGKTASQLQEEIRKLYVPKYYVGLNVTVYGSDKYFYVEGEVRANGKYEYPGNMTVVRAIAVAGGFTDFAGKTKVEVTHNGHKRKVNVSKAMQDPKFDVPVYPGDTIHVPRRIF